MDSYFSTKYLRLVIGLILLLFSSMNSSIEGFLSLGIGGIALVTAFASFGKCNYNGIKSKLSYRIIRYVLAGLLLLIACSQIYAKLSFGAVHYSAYASVVDFSLIAYLVFFKPSETSTSRKTCKIIGYILILVSVNALHYVQMDTHLYYPSVYSEINWSWVIFISIIMLIGVLCLKFGNKALKKAISNMVSSSEDFNQFRSGSNDLRNANTYNREKAINVLLKIFISLLLPTILILSMIWADDYDFEPWLFFYLPYYLFILFYYEWLIWRKKPLTGTDVLLMPVLNKLGLYNRIDNTIAIKKLLLKTIAPAVLASIVLPLITSLIFATNGHHERPGMHILLALPILIWIIALVFNYSSNWLSSSENEQTR